VRRLANLVRLHRLRLNERRRKLADLEAERDRLGAQQADLAREIEKEKCTAVSDFASGLTFTAYLAHFKARQERLQEAIDAIETRIGDERDRIAEAFADLKKHETVLANRKERERREQDRRQVNQQDEIALNIFRRRAAEYGGLCHTAAGKPVCDEIEYLTGRYTTMPASGPSAASRGAMAKADTA